METNPRFATQGEGAERTRPREGSPLIDHAVSLPVDTGGRDFAGIKLPQGKAPDVGAWEMLVW
jgi:hypothetical protein